MAEARRSVATLVPLVVAVLLLTLALATPWYEFDHSTGTQNPTATESPSDDPSRDVERSHAAFYPFRLEGDANATQGVDASDELQVLGLLAAGGAGLAALALLLEAVWGHQPWTRRAAVPLSGLAVAVVIAALAWAWVSLPPTLAHRGVEGFFTSRRVGQGGFIRTTASWGWVAAGVSLIGLAAFAAIKYAGGPIEVVELDALQGDADEDAHPRSSGNP